MLHLGGVEIMRCRRAGSIGGCARIEGDGRVHRGGDAPNSGFHSSAAHLVATQCNLLATLDYTVRNKER